MDWVSLDGAKVKARLRDVGMSQGTLADKVDMSRRQLERVLAGDSETSPEARDAIAECLGLSAGAITLRHEGSQQGERLEVGAPEPSYRDFDPLSVRGRLPGTPDRFLGRDDLVKEAVQRVLRVFDTEPPGRTRNRLILHGEGGNGKTTFLRALLNEPRVARRFGDNRLWCSLGPRGDPCEVLKEWCDAWGVTWLPRQWQAEDARDLLTHRIGDRPALLCIDDAWSEDQLTPLTIGGVRCCIVVTTRRNALAQRFAPEEGDSRYLGNLTEGDGLALLRMLAGSAAQDSRLHEVVVAVRGHPLALELAGLHLRGLAARGEPVASFLERLRQKTEEVMRLPIPRESAAYRDEILGDPTLFGLYRMSTEQLDDDTHWCLALAGNVFTAEPSHFDLRDAAELWQTSPEAAQHTLSLLADEGLVRVVRQGRYQIHQLLALYAKLFMTEEQPWRGTGE